MVRQTDAISAREFDLLARLVRQYVDSLAWLHEVAAAEASEAAQLVAARPRLPVVDAYLAPLGPLRGADDHFRLLAAGLVEPAVVLGVITAGRAAHEASALAYWLLEPPATIEQRCARYFSLRLSDLHRQAERARLIAKHETGEDAQQARERHEWAQARLAEVKAQARAAGLNPRSVGARSTVAREQLPEPSKLATLALEPHGHLGKLLYDRASSAAHGSMSGVLAFSVPADTSDQVRQGAVMMQNRLAGWDVALSLAPALLVHTLAVQALATALGHDLGDTYRQALQRLWVRVRAHLHLMPGMDAAQGAAASTPDPTP